MEQIKRSIGQYFQRTEEYSSHRFIIEMALIPFPLKFLLALVFSLLGCTFEESTTDAIADSGLGTLLVMGIIAAPLLETFIGQWIPIWVIQKFTRNVFWIVLISSVFFALQHLHVGLSGFLTAFPPGIFLSWSFLLKRNTSRTSAYWTTTAIHALHNSIAILFYLLLP